MIIIFFSAGFDSYSTFIRSAFAQNNYTHTQTESNQLPDSNSQQYSSTTNNPLLIYSPSQFEELQVTKSDENYDDAPYPNFTPSSKSSFTSSSRSNSVDKNSASVKKSMMPKNDISQKKNNIRNDNKKIRLAAVNSIDEYDRIVPAAPMPSDNSITDTNRQYQYQTDNHNINDNFTERRKFESGNSESGNSFDNLDRNNVTNIPNSIDSNQRNHPDRTNRLNDTNDSNDANDSKELNDSNDSNRKTAIQSNNQYSVDPYHPPIKTAAFNGVVPGQTPIKTVVELWGKPVREISNGGELAHLYSLHELNHIEVTYDRKRIVKSIVIRFDELFPENAVRENFESELLKSRPVLIPNETGKIIGELFPEKGVVFLFSGSKKGGMFQVRQIGIEPVISEPFVLRAEATLNDHPSESYRDLIDAIRINRTDAKAYWLLAKIDLLQGYTDTALLNVQKAIRCDERKPAYHLTLAQILSRMNRIEDAKLYLEETLAICERYPTDKARIHCMLGDFYRTGKNPDCERAYKHHSEAIGITRQLIDHANPMIRQTAKDILFESRLAVAKDIAWGHWKGKERAIENWIAGSQTIARDPEMTAAKRFSAEYPLKLAICELTCQVGINEEKDIEPHVKEVIQTGEKLLTNTNDPILLQKLQWEIGMAIYDAVQIYQLREKYELALYYGELAADYMESGIKGRTNESDMYLIGRLYFRLGTIHALGNKNHRAAIEWFNKSKPIFDRLFSKINPEESGRLGESLVSMGVSYWLTNQREEAIRLTERGLKQIERGVKLGFTKESAFAIPYSNLMNMYNELGNTERARHYSNLSRLIK